MLKLILLSTLQSIFLVASQIFLKLAAKKINGFSFSWDYFKALLVNWDLAFSGISITSATFLWIYILKYFPFSMAYPMISISYVFGMLAAIFIFHEAVPLSRWLGVAFIMVGVVIIARS